MTGGDESPPGNVLDVPFTRPRTREAVLDESRHAPSRRRATDLLDAPMEVPAVEHAPPVEQEFRGLRPKPDRRQLFVPMPPALERRRV